MVAFVTDVILVAISAVVAGLIDEGVGATTAQALSSLRRAIGIDAGCAGMQALRVGGEEEKEEKE